MPDGKVRRDVPSREDGDVDPSEAADPEPARGSRRNLGKVGCCETEQVAEEAWSERTREPRGGLEAWQST